MGVFEYIILSRSDVATALCLIVFTNLVIILLYSRWKHSLFVQLGIPGPKPLPLIGNLLFYKKGFDVNQMDCLGKYGRIYGFYEGQSPTLMVSDPEFIKQITVKQFDKFVNRMNIRGIGYPMKGSLTNLVDDEWRRVRNTMIAGFSAAKIKQIMPLINKCAMTLIHNIDKERDEEGVVEIKQYFGAFTMDVIAETGFSLELDSRADPKNPFVTNAEKMMSVTHVSPSVVLMYLFPFLQKYFIKYQFSMFPKEACDFYVRTLERLIKERQGTEHGQGERVDFMQMMLNSHNGVLLGHSALNRVGLTMDEILAQTLLFFIAGYETTANTLTWAAYSLARHPDVQEKVLEEINHWLPEFDFEPSYDFLMKLTYLDQVIDEILRLHPAVYRFDRLCSKDTEICGVKIAKGTTVATAMYALHHDPELWDNPLEFNPDRFSPENMDKHHPYAHIPFGAGPRICIATRFAQIEIKAVLAHVMQKYKFDVCEKTVIPPPIKKSAFYAPRDGVILKVTPRE